MQNFGNKSSIKDQIDKWLSTVLKEHKSTQMVRKHNRCNMNVSGISLLMRCQTEGVDGLCLVIATVRLEDSLRGQGWMKSFINYCIDINPWEKIVIEDVDNLKFRAFCKNSGFTPVSDFFSTSFIVNQEFVRSLEVKEFDS